MSRYFLGIDVGGTKCGTCLGDDAGNIIDKSTFPTLEPQGPEQAIANFIRCADAMLEKHSISIEGVGIACGSPLDWVQGIIQSPAQLPSWKDVHVKRVFEDHFKVPAFLDNDANAGATAEHVYGAGRGCNHMAFLTFGTGMGAGFILNGKIYRGANCYAGEVGHMRLTDDGPVGCRKAGSFEGWCSGAGIAQIAEMEIANWKDSTLLTSGASARDVGEAAGKGDALAIRILEISGHYLGYALAQVLDILNLERVVIGSIFKRCEKFLRPAMEKAIAAEALQQTASQCVILPSKLGDSIGDYAALSIAYSEMR